MGTCGVVGLKLSTTATEKQWYLLVTAELISLHSSEACHYAKHTCRLATHGQDTLVPTYCRQTKGERARARDRQTDRVIDNSTCTAGYEVENRLAMLGSK